MLTSGSGFIASSIAVPHNAIKSILFRSAELLLAYTIWKIFSLLAARTKKFTSYLMFREDLVQKFWFICTQKCSSNGILVLGFTVVYSLAQLYGTLLWALDDPGYILQNHNVSAVTLQNSLLESPDYVLSLTMRSANLSDLDNSLAQIIGGNLYNPGVNFTLTGDVSRGTPEVTPPTRPEAGARIWLDNEGFSVSPDTAVMVSYTNVTGKIVGLDCPVQKLSEKEWGWNCTFSNSFVPPLIQSIIGRPEVHWDDASDSALDSRYIRPNRENNIWASFGEGGGTAVMKQMFTVTKGTRRHTFIETTAKFSMVASAGVSFSQSEVSDFVKRSWSSNREEQQAPNVDHVIDSILESQDLGRSYMVGRSFATNLSCAQTHWEFLTSEVNEDSVFSLLRISTTNITLIRSENLGKSPQPYGSCDASFQNEAQGGRVYDTDCAGSVVTEVPPKFFGQVDLSAVLVVYGLGYGRSNISSKALDQSKFLWLQKNSAGIDDLLVSRGFILSVDPALVNLKKGSITPAISYLQLLLLSLAVLAAPFGWICIQLFASPHWSNSLLSNLLHTVSTSDNGRKLGPGYIRHAPDIRLTETSREDSSQGVITINNTLLKLEDHGARNEVYFAPYYPSNPVPGNDASLLKGPNLTAQETTLLS